MIFHCIISCQSYLLNSSISESIDNLDSSSQNSNIYRDLKVYNELKICNQTIIDSRSSSLIYNSKKLGKTYSIMIFSNIIKDTFANDILYIVCTNNLKDRELSSNIQLDSS